MKLSKYVKLVKGGGYCMVAHVEDILTAIKISWPAPAAGAANTCTMRTGMSRTSAGSVGRLSNGDKP